MKTRVFVDATDPFSGVELRYGLTPDPERSFRRRSLERAAAECPRVLDVGRGARSNQSLFAHNRYAVLSMDDADEPDHKLDVCRMADSLGEASFDAVLCISVLEHVYDPSLAVENIRRVLTPGGVFFGYVPFLIPFHGAGSPQNPTAYRDYWRFTDQGLAYLLRGFADLRIAPQDGNAATVARMLPGPLRRLRRLADVLDQRLSYRQASGWNFLAIRPR